MAQGEKERAYSGPGPKEINATTFYEKNRDVWSLD